MAILYMLMCISVIGPIYTYALYPFILRLFPERSCKLKDGYAPTVSILIIGDNDEAKRTAIKNSDYNNVIEVRAIEDQTKAGQALHGIGGDVVIVTDSTSDIQKDAISLLIKHMSDSRVGCACGMVRKRPGENGETRDGANWYYENKVKDLESNIGCLSGANTALYAVKKEYLSSRIDTHINLDFFLPTVVTEKGDDVVFVSEAVAYEAEGKTEKDLFRKHVLDGVSGYRSIARFWRLLLPRKGSFVFWSHRVIKWLVPFNLLFFMIASIILWEHAFLFKILTASQIVGYAGLILYHYMFGRINKKFGGAVGKLVDFAYYFFVLNWAWFVGFIKLFKTNENQ